MLNDWKSRLEKYYLDGCGFGSGSAFTAQLVESVVPGDVLLDAGCGEGGSRRLLPSSIHYVGLDRYFGTQSKEYPNWSMRPAVLGDVHELPFADSSFITVALMHVLEHTHTPVRVFNEIYRVLKPSGLVFVDVPFFHEIHHAPHDFFRFTPFALKRIAEDSGLEVVEVRPSGGYFRALAYLLEAAPIVIQGGTAVTKVACFLVAYPLKGLGWMLRKMQYLLDLLDRKQIITCGYHCVFKKPDL